jgi:hypothetical protein
LPALCKSSAGFFYITHNNLPAISEMFAQNYTLSGGGGKHAMYATKTAYLENK